MLQDKVIDTPAMCGWAGCKQTGLTLGTVTHHRDTCSFKRMACVCGKFVGTKTALLEHESGCMQHHTTSLRKEVQEDITRLATKLAKVEDLLARSSGRVERLERDNRVLQSRVDTRTIFSPVLSARQDAETVDPVARGTADDREAVAADLVARGTADDREVVAADYRVGSLAETFAAIREAAANTRAIVARYDRN